MVVNQIVISAKWIIFTNKNSSQAEFMKRHFRILQISILILVTVLEATNCCAQMNNYLEPVKKELQKKWPENKTINLVFHGHSVPSGYFDTPNVHTLDAYPHQVLALLKAQYPYAVINCITTSIGGENSEQGAKRFSADVLTHRPDVIFIDYALNDRGIGLERAKTAWEVMIKQALQNRIKLILLTPTPDVTEDIKDNNALLAQHTRQIKELGNKYYIPVVDSYGAFKKLADDGAQLGDIYMAQPNHINTRGHQIVAQLIATLFKSDPK